MNHSCLPNTNVINVDRGGGKQLVALRTIEAHEEITISYMYAAWSGGHLSPTTESSYSYSPPCIQYYDRKLNVHVDSIAWCLLTFDACVKF